MTATAGSGRPTLTLVEAARGLAALAVVVFHANVSAGLLGAPEMAGVRVLIHGVDVFFVLSGFIIAHVHLDDMGRRSRAGGFVRKRAQRLLPLLWLAVAVAAMGNLYLGHAVSGARALASALLVPAVDEPMPMVVWTLRHEAIFYALFALVIMSKRAGLVLAGAVLVGTLAQLALGLAGYPLGGPASVVLSTYNLQFAAGVAVALAYRRGWLRAPAPLLLAGTALTVLVAATGVLGVGERAEFLDYGSRAALLGPIAYAPGFALLLAGLLAAEGRVTVPAPLMWLGAASYALYLFHTLANAAIQGVVARLPAVAMQVGVAHLAFVLAGLVVGGGLHWCYDKPVRDWMTHRRRIHAGVAAPAQSSQA